MTADNGGVEPASDLVHEDVPRFLPKATVAEALSLLRERRPAAAYIAVCDGQGLLLGLAPLSSLVAADPGSALRDITTMPATIVTPAVSTERVAWLAAHQGAEVVAVTDRSGSFIGLIPAHKLLAQMVHEHELDLARVGGFLRGTRRARTASEEPVLRRVWHRGPWLALGLLGAVLAAKIVSAFEDDLEAEVTLAFFLPGIVYMADAVGTQTETLVIRGLSVGVRISQIVRLEVLTGAFVGLLLSLTIFPLAWLVTGQSDMAAVVSLSLMASASCATLVAMTLPWAFDTLGFDPAFGSGPLATVIQDLFSILIYFAIALAVLN